MIQTRNSQHSQTYKGVKYKIIHFSMVQLVQLYNIMHMLAGLHFTISVAYFFFSHIYETKVKVPTSSSSTNDLYLCLKPANSSSTCIKFLPTNKAQLISCSTFFSCKNFKNLHIYRRKCR